MAKLVFFIGGAGAGKTTLAKALASRRKAAVLDMDTLLRPAAEALMTLAGFDPSDRDSSEYKRLCRDLGYRITMDVALENVDTRTDVLVIGPFTKESENPQWIHEELARISATVQDVEIKVVVVYLAAIEDYRSRIEQRKSELDRWKLDNWDEFSRSLSRREPKWKLEPNSVLYFDNSQPLGEEEISSLESFVFGRRNSISSLS
jgi:dephospho-CoA kinase